MLYICTRQDRVWIIHTRPATNSHVELLPPHVSAASGSGWGKDILDTGVFFNALVLTHWNPENFKILCQKQSNGNAPIGVLYPSLWSPYGGLRDLIYTSSWGFVVARSDRVGTFRSLNAWNWATDLAPRFVFICMTSNHQPPGCREPQPNKNVARQFENHLTTEHIR